MSLIQESLQLVDFKCNYPKKGINSYDSLSKDGRIYAATIINKNILSICGMSHLGYGYCVDIGVETSNFYRNRGFATSNVVYMAKHLLENNTDFTYTCSKKNSLSQCVAAKANMKLIAQKTIYLKD